MDKKTFWVGLLVSLSVPILEALVHLDTATLTDWRSYLVGLGAASVRQGAVYVLAEIAKRRA